MRRAEQPVDYDYLANLRRNHPAWRLLATDGAPFVLAFFSATTCGR
jgi:hypothetical protein